MRYLVRLQGSATVAVAEMAMHRIVVPNYAGSSPVGHLSIKLKALGPNRVTLGRRGTVRFGYSG